MDIWMVEWIDEEKWMDGWPDEKMDELMNG